jgi:ubiquinone/menaquinone biosynthesis C-methylase UbiE
MYRAQEIKRKKELWMHYRGLVQPRRIFYLGDARVLHNPFYEDIKEQPGTIIDCGCGPGDDTRQFLKDGFSPTGVDMNEKGFQLGYDWYGDSEKTGKLFRTGNVTKLEFRSGMFRYSYSGSLIHGLKTEENARAYLSEAFRTLMAGGYIFGSTLGVKKLEKAKHKRLLLLTRDELSGFLKDAEFKNVQIEDSPNKKPDLKG